MLAIVLDRITQGLGRTGRDRGHRHWWQTGPVGAGRAVRRRTTTTAAAVASARTARPPSAAGTGTRVVPIATSPSASPAPGVAGAGALVGAAS